MDKGPRYVLGYILLTLATFAALELLAVGLQRAAPVIPYSEFEQALKQGRIKEVSIDETTISGSYKDSDEEFTTVRVAPDVASSLQAAGVKFSGRLSPTPLLRIASWILPTAGFLVLWYFLARRLGGGIQSGTLPIGKSKARLYAETGIRTTFADVAGVDEAKQELQEVIAFLRSPLKYGRLGAHVPKGILLVGPPGTGKTLLARAVAGEAGVAFLSISGSEFVEMFVGVGAARVRDLFEQARRSAPCIIFIDELDALGRARGIGPASGGHDEKEQTLNQLLAELDGFDPTVGVVLLAATNRPEILDAALLRAGRFDRQILVDRPDKAGRVQILNVHIRKVRLAAGVSVEEIAALTPGFSGADLANLVNEAAILATRRDAMRIEMVDFTDALERIVAGLQKRNRLLNPRERKVVAYHETGHTLVALALPGTDVVQKVSIIPRGIGALGYTLQRPTDDRYLMSRDELMDRMTVLLGGRAAESEVFDEESTGAADDLAKATDIARSMVTRYGMAERLGPVSYESVGTPFLGPTADDFWRPRHYAESTAALIDDQVKALLEEACERARAILRSHRPLLVETAERLLVKETLLPEDLEPSRGRMVAHERAA